MNTAQAPDTQHSPNSDQETPDQITIRQPDDWHVHLRDGDMLNCVAAYTAQQFARAIVMPNLSPPITSADQAAAYRDRIMKALPTDSQFTPLMTCYLTDNSDPDDLGRGFQQGIYTAAKLYPANATTNSAHGVSDIGQLDAALLRMQKIGMPLLIHGEVTDSDVDIFDREALFIDQILGQLVARYPALKIVFEHITTEQAVDFVDQAGPNIGATITPQHLHINRNAMLVGGIRPHAYCLPVAKRERHRLALRRAATSGSAKYFLGTDSAPHSVDAKENACGCAGIFNAPFALESYITVFEEEGKLEHFERFASENGPRFYGLPLNEGRITLRKETCAVPPRMGALAASGSPETGAQELVPFHAGEVLRWRLLKA